MSDEMLRRTRDRLGSAAPSTLDRFARYEAGGVDDTISPHDDMFQPHRRDHYFATGRSAIEILALAMAQAGVETFASVIDLPSGSGRVLRHLVRFLPEAHVIACDIDPEHVRFCSSQFGATPLMSGPDLTHVSPGRPIDLLWCGSLLTHLPANGVRSALRHMVSWLAPGGLGIFTLHGRWSLVRQATTPYKYMGDSDFEPIERGVRSEGFGYADYDPGHKLGQVNYGVSVALPSWTLRTVEDFADVRVLDYTERAWDNHQDVLVLRKVPLAARPWIFEDTER